jgi:hypothetical protein
VTPALESEAAIPGQGGDRSRLLRPPWSPLTREALLAALIAASLAALLGWVGPPGNDLAAHVYLRREFVEHGFTFWSNFWYSGRYSYITYSPLYYPLAAVIGIRLLATITIAVSAFAFAMVVGRQWGAPARWSSRSFAVVWAAVVFSAVFPFVLGCTLALLALWALQAGARWRFTLLVVLTLVASPLAFLLLVVVAAGIGLARKQELSRLLQPAGTFLACALLGLLVWRLFPSSGRYPFSPIALVDVGIFCAIGAALTWRVERARPLRWIFPVYFLACLVAFVVPSELGSNVARLRLMALPLAVLVFSLRGYRPRLFVIPVLALALYWNLGPIAEGFDHGLSDPAAEAGYWTPAIRFLHQNLTPSYRVEVVDTVGHWAAVYLPRADVPLTRGWYRQDDFPQNEALYEHLSAHTYLSWLRSLGVRYVILTDAPTDYSARQEARLIRGGRSGLRPVFRQPNLTVYAVPHPRALVSGPGRPRVLSMTEAGLRLWLDRPGLYRVAVHYSPYWQAEGACLEQTQDGMIAVTASRAGSLDLAFDVDAGRALSVLAGDETSTCAVSS